MLEFRGKTEMQILDLVRVQLGSGGLTDPAERRAFAEAVPPEMVSLWRKGSKRDKQTQVGSAKLKERACQVDSAREAASGEKVT